MLRHASEVMVLGHSDLTLLPEASLTGYVSPKRDFDLTRFAEPLDGPTAQACADLAKRNNTHLVAPLILKESAGTFNAMVCYGPDGKNRFVYRKRHPWFPEQWATPGPQPLPLLRIKDLTITAAICFDVHFLEEDSAEQLDLADVLLYPSAWVDDEPDAPARLLLMQRLAVHFGVYVVNANWGPGNPRIAGQGGSCILGPGGAVLGEVQPGQVSAVADLEP
jgi:5-aminopentanamidase